MTCREDGWDAVLQVLRLKSLLEMKLGPFQKDRDQLVRFQNECAFVQLADGATVEAFTGGRRGNPRC